MVLVEHALPIAEMTIEEGLVDAFDVDVGADELPVDGQACIVRARDDDALLPQNVIDEAFAEETAELDRIVEGHPAKPEEALAVDVLVEPDQVAALVARIGIRGTVALEADADVLDRDVVPVEGGGNVDAIGQCLEHGRTIGWRDVKADPLYHPRRVERFGLVRCEAVSRRCRDRRKPEAGPRRCRRQCASRRIQVSGHRSPRGLFARPIGLSEFSRPAGRTSSCPRSRRHG